MQLTFEPQTEVKPMLKFETTYKPVSTKLIRGLVIGKFMPMTKGHMALINYAKSMVDELTVMVCSLSTEPIDGQMRYEWVRDTFPNVRVVHLDREDMPQEPKDHPDFWSFWKLETKRFHPEPLDFIFSSEDYGYKYAEVMNCTHIQFDKERKIVPISATKVRNNPFAQWDFIPDIVKPYYSKKVLVIGGESTGKSTLTENLSLYFNGLGLRTAGVQEFARAWIDTNLDGDMNRLLPHDILSFGRQQMTEVKRAEMNGNKLIISDTDALVSAVFYKKFYGGEMPQYLVDIVIREKWDLVLFLQPDVPWIDDGQRNLGSEEDREDVRITFKKLLTILDWNYVEIEGSWYERLDKSITEVKKILF